MVSDGEIICEPLVATVPIPGSIVTDDAPPAISHDIVTCCPAVISEGLAEKTFIIGFEAIGTCVSVEVGVEVLLFAVLENRLGFVAKKKIPPTITSATIKSDIETPADERFLADSGDWP